MSQPFTPEVAAAILLEVRENHARLEACPRHEFDVIEPVKVIGNRYRCKACQGTTDSHGYFWWNRGMKDAYS